MTIVGIIIARGGSKRLPGKNVRPLAGKPMIAWTVEAALAARRLDHVIVSTDHDGIAAAARDAGAAVPFRRPAELARDDTPPVPVLNHALDHLDAQGIVADVVVLLQATSPLRRARHIDEAIEIFVAGAADTVTAVSPAPGHPYWAWTLDQGELRPFFTARHMEMARAELPPAYVENGSVYVIDSNVLRRGTLYGGRMLPYHICSAAAVDVDTEMDFAWAEFLMKRDEA